MTIDFEFHSLPESFGTYTLEITPIGKPLAHGMAGEDEYGGYYLDNQGNQFGWPEMLEFYLDDKATFRAWWENSDGTTSPAVILSLEEAVALIEG